MKQKISLKKEKEYFLKIIRRLKFQDVLPLLILPIISTIIFLLPNNWQDLLKLSTKNPQFWQYLTSSFVHQDYGHFKSNILMFVIIALFIIFISLRLNNMKYFNKGWIISLAVVPIIVSISNLFQRATSLPNLEYACGASGLVAAFIGFIPIIWIKVVYPKFKTEYHIMNLLVLYLAFFLSAVYLKETYLIILLVLFMAIYIFIIRNEFIKIKVAYLNFAKESFFTYLILAVAILLFFILPYSLFPKKIIADNGALVNFFAHYVGIVYGVFFSFIYFNFKEIKDKIKSIFHKPTTP